MGENRKDYAAGDRHPHQNRERQPVRGGNPASGYHYFDTTVPGRDLQIDPGKFFSNPAQGFQRLVRLIS
jgi:hypothetical protein